MPQPFLTLNNGVQIPQLGLGTWQTPDDVAAAAVSNALKDGYRLIDTAAIYENETGVGRGLQQGLKAAALSREDVFVTTKLWNSEQGYDSALRAYDESLKLLQLDYVDLYLLHWPAPKKDLYVDSWKALVRLLEEKRVRAIGVSNFEPAHLERIIKATGVTPAVNQIELHPDFQQTELNKFHVQHNILTQSWSPLGQGALLKNEVIRAIAQKHNKTPAQVVIRWHLEQQLLVIPKSIHAPRISENFAVFDFALDAEDLAKIRTLDAPKNRIGPHPDTADF
ncbi:oxidoreductase [Betaproteobacteria bacterium]|nr:oxidoreductase [Betaproteobacteria bacterium]GHU44062.1 oxidoreductase [Betaproteobacteria bacterium]